MSQLQQSHPSFGTIANSFCYFLRFIIARMQALQQKAFVSGTAVQAKTRVAAKTVRSAVVVRAQKEDVC